MASLFVILSVLAIPVSIWMIVYFGSKIILDAKIKRDLGNMPTREELHTWYEQNNSIVTYSPITRDKTQQ